ncbi:breast carcinoma-amplified sequence 1 isoform X7 [Bufo gargarizans]|uniref:breast carcinoma-amplified sequence 1 isoform X7 n=1 Tax=Bufo gargarizans TaxID=30331 RepID=UPI001CF47642|nr:breast carcinoma-amplified sequence 1 isoform X7 [Bufo gargarizans]
MGNEVSSSEVEEEQEEPIKESNLEFAGEVQNGPVILQSSPALNSAPGVNYVSSKQVVQQENMIASSQKTIVVSPISNGSVTNPPPPVAKSKFRLTISRPSPGRTSFQPNGQGDVGPVKPEITLQESPVVQTQLMTPIGPDSMTVKENFGGVQNQAPPSVLTAEEASSSSTNPTEEEMACTKPKEVSIFHKIFKPEKKMQSALPPVVTINQPMVITVDQNTVLQSSPPSNGLQSQSVEDDDQSASAEEQSIDGQESASEATQNTPPVELHPVMSFFKTLVTPNKSVLKSEEEVKTEGEDKKKENGGFRKSSSKKEKHKSTVHQTSDTEAKTLKKSESPKSGTLSRLFKQKSKKEEQNTSGSKDVLEQSVVSVSVNSEKSPPEQVLIQDPKSSDVPTQITASEEEGKAAKVSTAPRPKLFWRKSFKGEPQPNKPQQNGVEEQSVSVASTPEQISVQDTKSPDSNVQPTENEKPMVEPSSRSVPFWRKSFKGDPQPRINQDNVVVEQPVVSVSVNSEKSPPEQVLTPDTKPLDTPEPESEKPQKEAAARPVPFWRKSFKADPPPQKVPENSSSEPEPQSSKSNTGDKGATPGVKSPENKRPEDAKSTKPKIMMFFKQLSVLGDGSNISPEESNEKRNQEPTLDITDGVEVSKNEKTVVTAVVEPPPPPPPPQKGKDNMKEKKASAEKLNKQESRESAEIAASAQFHSPDPVQVDNAVGAFKEGQLKRTEKRQSLGSFFKAIGPKRMLDAEVQTDPVTILPAEKTK